MGSVHSHLVIFLVITLALTGSNLLSVKNYGEFEFWLALCKVIAIPGLYFPWCSRN